MPLKTCEMLSLSPGRQRQLATKFRAPECAGPSHVSMSVLGIQPVHPDVQWLPLDQVSMSSQKRKERRPLLGTGEKTPLTAYIRPYLMARSSIAFLYDELEIGILEQRLVSHGDVRQRSSTDNLVRA